MNVVERVSKAIGLKKSPAPAVNTVFDKFAGADGKLDKAEFKNLLQSEQCLAGSVWLVVCRLVRVCWCWCCCCGGGGGGKKCCGRFVLSTP